MRTKLLTVLITLCFGFILCQPVLAVNGIKDINGHWAQVHIEKWINDGLIAGYPDGQFKPDGEITRAELVTLVNKAFKTKNNDTIYDFSDVKSSDWFYAEVMSAKAAGYISGYPDGTFKPNEAITRQEAAALITTLLNPESEDESVIKSFNDYQSIDSWAKSSVNEVAIHGIMSGFPDKTFGPQKNITRAETVVTLDKALAYKPEKISGINGVIKLNHQPVKGATVKVFSKGSYESQKEVITGPDGSFTFSVADGQYEITALQDKNAGYMGPITVIKGSAAGAQEILMTTGARVSGKLLDKQGDPLVGIPLYFTTNPTFSGKTDNNGGFSIVLPTHGPDGQLLSYTGFFFYNGTRKDFATNQQFSGDTDLGQVQTDIPGQSSPSIGGGGGGGSAPPPPDDTTPPAWISNYPKTADITPTSLKLLVKTNESGIAYYVVLADGAAAPSTAEVKNGTGKGDMVAVKSGQAALMANNETSITISSLNSNTAYDIYAVAEDAAENLQSDPLKLDVITSAADPGDTTPPLVSSTSVNGNTLALIYNENLDEISVPLSTDFKVKVNGSEQEAPLNPSVMGTKVTITLAQSVKAGDTVTISYTPGANPIKDIAGNKAATLVGLPVTNHSGELVAPAIDRTVATDLFSSTSFLYSGENAVQTGMAPETIEQKRVAIIRGKVFTRDNTPLPDVRITILNHPEFGSTLSHSDGQFDMAVNGGGVLTVRYEKDNYIAAQRRVDVPWQDFAILPDVVIIPYDSNKTEVTLTPASPMQVARGSEIRDADGTRQATLVIPAGVTAQLQDGTPISNLTVRATEYTVGTNGPQAMPAILPPNVGYTYCVEYSADEAIAAGSKSVIFNQPIYHYVENFIGFPVGSVVPMGYYDYDLAAWIPSRNGRVIKILEINDGLAELDINGTGVATDIVALASLGITDSERQKLAALYQEGQELWRVPITHFTPWDCNWPYGPPAGARGPEVPLPEINTINDPCKGRGSIIEYQNQALGEAAKVYGTSFSLNYNSNRVEGNKQQRSIEIPVSGANLPEGLKEIILEVQVAGQFYRKKFEPIINQSYTYTWNGKNPYGQTFQGSTPIHVRIGYVYQAVYMNPPPTENVFSSYGSGPFPFEWKPGRNDLTVTAWQEWSGTLSYWDSAPAGIGGWSLNVHHAYVPNSGMLYLGDGSRTDTGSSQNVISTVAGAAVEDSDGDGFLDGAYSGDNGLASLAQLNRPFDVAVGADGSIFIADGFNHRIRKISPEGIITTIAGNPTGNERDNGPASMIKIGAPLSIALGPDGSIYFAENARHRIRRVSPDGLISVVAGTGSYGLSGDGGLAIEAQLNAPGDIAVATDGSIYIADTNNHRIRRIDPNGIISTIAGTGTGSDGGGFSGDGDMAVKAQLTYPNGVAIGPDGSLYIADSGNNCIRRIGINGMITTVAGNEGANYIAVTPDGTLIISDYRNHSIRRVTSDGIISTVAGKGTQGYSGDGDVAAEAQLNYPCGIALSPDGSLYIADTYNQRIRRVGQPSYGILVNEYLIADQGGNKLFVFDANGRHQRTINALTGSAIYTFTYNEQGQLTAVTDVFGNVTTIERDAAGNPMKIIAPGGQKTYLEVNENGYLSSISCPYEIPIDLAYTNDNLLTMFSDHKGNVHRFSYDEMGRLTRDEDPAGGYTQLSRTQLDNGYKVNVNTAEGRESSYKVEYIPGVGTRMVNTDSAGGLTIIEIDNNGARKVTYPDGTVATMAVGPDPRPGIGIRSPITKEFTIKTPAGLASTVTRERTVEMDDVDDLFSVTKITDTVNNNGKQYKHTYDIDNASQTVTVTTTTPEGRQTQSTLDWRGRLIKEVNDSLQETSYTYDEKGHLTGVRQGELSLAYTYDDMNRIIAIQDAAGDKSQYTYNDADLLKSITMPGGQTYAFSNDYNGNVTEIKMPSNAVHELDYTAIDLAQSYTPPGNSSYQKSYNRDRALTQLNLPSGRNVNYSYDNSGRIIALVYDPVSSSFGYNDLTNRVTGISRNPDGISYNYLYDGALITQMSASVSDVVYGRYSYSYDDNFNLVGFTLDGTPEVMLAYDNDGLLTQYGGFAVEHSGPLGAPSQISNGNMSVTYTYDTYGRPIERTNTVNGQQIYSLETGYDNAGMIKFRKETVSGAVAESTYTYDANKQLTGVSGGMSESYTYDVNGNRLTGGATYDEQDRLTNLGDVRYQFNTDGFLAQRGTDIFEHTAQGELRDVTLPDKKVSYTYDGLGRRVGRTVTTGTEEEPVITKEQYLYGNLGNPFQITAMRDNAGSLSEYYYDLSNCLFAIKQGLTWYYVATDQQGTPRIVSDASGAIIKQVKYDSYGKLISDSNPNFPLPVGYAGGISDPDTKLVHFGMRDYDPDAGRWTARDPILFNGQQGNLYVYVNNNPVNLRDPYGLFCIGGSAYLGFGGGGQICVTGEGVSLCAEVGFGIGTSVEVSPFGGLAGNGSEVGIQGGLTFAGIGPSGGITLDDCGSLKFSGGLSVGPVSGSVSYDFLEGTWSIDDLAVGGEVKDLNNKVSDSFNPGFGGNFKAYGKSCMQL